MSLLKQLLGQPMTTGPVYDAFRRSHEIEGSTEGAQTDYQTKVTAFYKLLPASDKWIWHDDCPILTVGAGGTWDDDRLGGGSMVKVGDTYYLYYCGYDGSDWAIGVATSTDGVNFTKYGGNPILQHDGGDAEEDLWIWSPIVLYYEGTFYMYYTARYTPNKECIRLATGSNYHTFTKQGTMLSPDDGDAEAWEDNWACHPDIPLWDGSQWVLLYCGGILAGSEDAGRATASSLSGPWTRDLANNPIIVHNQNAPWDVTIAYAPRVLRKSFTEQHLPVLKDGVYYCYISEVDGGKQRVNYSTTTDFITFTRYSNDPILRYDWDLDDGVQPNSVVLVGDTIWFYTTSSTSATKDWGIALMGTYNQNVNLNEKCKTDFGDIRFRQGVTELEYWIQEKVDSEYAVIWVEVPTIPADPNTTTIHIYYGKGTATTTSSGDDTFPFFDDFEDESIDDPPDAAKWTTAGIDGADWILVKEDPDDPTNKVLGIHESGDATITQVKTIQFPDVGGVAIGIKYYRSGGKVAANNYMEGRAEDVNGVAGPIFVPYTYFDPEGRQHYHNGAAAVDYAPTVELAVTTWCILEYRLHSLSAILAVNQFGINTPLLYTGGYFAAYANIRYFQPQRYEKAEVDRTRYLDNVYVRKLVDPEPNEGAWGSEEAVAWPF